MQSKSRSQVPAQKGAGADSKPFRVWASATASSAQAGAGKGASSAKAGLNERANRVRANGDFMGYSCEFKVTPPGPGVKRPFSASELRDRPWRSDHMEKREERPEKDAL